MDTLKTLSNRLKDDTPRPSQKIYYEITDILEKIARNFDECWNLSLKIGDYSEVSYDEGFEAGFKAATKLFMAGMQ
jgi:hypothetical protein